MSGFNRESFFPTCHQDNPVLVHTDLLNIRLLINNQSFDRNNICRNSLKKLLNITNQRPLVFPTFNYDFPKHGVFDVNKTPSQVGPFTEFIRTKCADWRTAIPFFSVCGIGHLFKVKEYTCIEPFGEDSIFDLLFKNNGSILFYGAPISAVTFLHYVEHVLGPPLYRYEKSFKGAVINNGKKNFVDIKFHVRPLGKHLDYDWVKIYNDLLLHGLININNDLKFKNIFALSVSKVVDFWYSRLKIDPFYFLDVKTLLWVKPIHKKLKRRFEISDFENIL